MAGAFLPAVNIPVAGAINLFGNGNRDGWTLVILGLIVIVLSFARYLGEWEVVPSILAGGVTYWSYFDIDRVFTKNALSLGVSIQLQIGWVVIGVGILLTIVVFLAGGQRPNTGQDADEATKEANSSPCG